MERRHSLHAIMIFTVSVRCCESSSQHLQGALPPDKNVSQRDAKQFSATENYKSNSCEFRLVASRRMRVWQLLSISRCLHCRKVNGEENQRGCKQCNNRGMCSPGWAMPRKSCRGDAGCIFIFIFFPPARPTSTDGPRCLITHHQIPQIANILKQVLNKCAGPKLAMVPGGVYSGSVSAQQSADTDTLKFNKSTGDYANLTCFHLSRCVSIREM